MFLAEKYLALDDVLTASAYRQKAEALMWVGASDSVKHFLNKALPIFKSNKEWEDFGWTKVLLAVNYLNNYELDSCEMYLNQVSDLLNNEALSDDVFADLQSTMFDLKGVVFEFQGNYTKAVQNLNEALEVNLQVQNKTKIDSGFISNQFNSLGSIYLSKGDYLRAEDNFLQAINFDENAMLDANLLNNIGNQYFKQRKYHQAKAYFEKSKNVSEQLLVGKSIQKSTISKHLTESLNNLCSCYRALGQYDQALLECKKAEEQSKGYKNYITWKIMGNIYIEKGQATEAINYLKKSERDVLNHADEIQDRIFIQSSLYYQFGKAELLNQNLKKSLYYFQKSLIENHKYFNDSLQVENNPPLDGIYKPIYFLEIIRDKASTQVSIATDSKTLIPALESYQLTVQWIDSLKASYVLESSQINWAEDFKPIYEEAIDVAYELYQYTKETKYLEIAFGFSEKSRSSILLEQLKSKKGKFKAGIPDSLLQKSKDLNLDIVFYSQELTKAKENKEKDKIELYQNYLSQNRLEMTLLEEKMEKQFPKFYKVKYAPESITIRKVQEELLSDKSAVLEYFVGVNTAYVFVIAKDTCKLIQLENVENLNSNVDDFLERMQDVDNFRTNAQDAVKNFSNKSIILYEQLLAKSLLQIASSIDHLIIVPDGILNTLSFEALTDSELISNTLDFAELPFLIYKYRFQYTFSAQLLLENEERISKIAPNNQCLGFAPNYQSSQSIALNGNFNALRNSSENLAGVGIEISAISNFVKGDYYLSDMASEKRFKQKSEQYGILHLAMHGAVDLNDPNYNHLKFSNMDVSSDEDNMLYQYEIANMNLDAQLVVLSACETGVGKYAQGEGVYSLGRSFMYAGTPSVVMSLWKVSDASTSQIMPYFYENLSNNESKVAALHNAKLKYLRSADLAKRHPFYWSAFVVVGEGGVLKSTNYNYYYLIFGFLVLILVGWMISKKMRHKII